jgi:hypothetical protein
MDQGPKQKNIRSPTKKKKIDLILHWIIYSPGLPFTFTWKESSDLELMKEEAMLNGPVVAKTKESVSRTNGVYRCISEKEGGSKLFIICQKAIIC